MKRPPFPSKRSTATLSFQSSVASARIRFATGAQSGDTVAEPASCGTLRASPSASAARTIIFVGTQAQYGHSPPSNVDSTPITSRPARASVFASSSPPGPMPTTTTSARSVIRHLLRVEPATERAHLARPRRPEYVPPRMAKPLTVLFMPESAYGPTNNCVGIGDVLRRRGHHVVFAAEASWRGKLAALGFEEDLVDLAPPPESPNDGERSPASDAGQFWTDFVKETAPVFRLPTIEQLETFIRPTWEALIDGARYCQPQLESVIDRHRPDVVVEDNVCAFPALVTAGAPFVRIVSCNPLEIPGARIPPTTIRSGPRSVPSTTGCTVHSGRSSTNGCARAGHRVSPTSNSCTSPGSPICTCTQRQRTTSGAGHSPPRGTDWSPRCAGPSGDSTRLLSWRTCSIGPAGRSSTCRWARSGPPTASSWNASSRSSQGRPTGTS